MNYLQQNYTVRNSFFSFRVETRAMIAVLSIILAISIVSIWAISAGDFPMTIGEVLASVFGFGQKSHDFIVFSLRLPRLLTGLAVGAAFGLSGAIFQSIARNPLASPDIIGFNAGATLGAICMIILYGASAFWVATGAVAGGLLTALLVFGLSWQNGLSPYRLVLIGIGVGFTAYAAVDFILTRSDIFAATAATQWITGTLNARLWSDVYFSSISIAILMPLALMLQTSLDRLEMGDDLASALGIRVNFIRGLIALVGVLLSSIAVATVGPITFVALVSAPLARRLTLSSGPNFIAASLVGSLVIISADLMGRLVFAPMQLSAGIFTAVMGAPFLLWLLATQIRKGAM